jgi:hypothetical protein
VIAGALTLAGVAHAAVSAFDPDNGQMAPGGSTSATFEVTPPGLLGFGFSCLIGSAAPTANPLLPTPSISVSFDAPCGSFREVEMTVAATAGTSPGSYIVTVTETELLVDGDLLGTYEWPLTITGPTTTTTTTTTTTSTTTTTPASSTTTPGPGGTSPTTTAGSTIPSGPTTTAVGSGPAITAPGDAPEATTSTSTPRPSEGGLGDDDDDVVFVVSAPDETDGDLIGLDPDLVTAIEGEPASYTRLAFSDRLRSELEGNIPSVISDAVLSPLVIGEILFRSLLEHARGFLLPLILATLVAMWFVWKMRAEIDVDELDI